MFAAAVVLFMMITQCQPFEQAKTNDRYYKFIAGNKIENYFKLFEKFTSFSDDLKELLADMLQLDPSARLTIDEIIAHPWVQGTVPTHEQVFREMTARKLASEPTRFIKDGNTN